MDEPTDTIILMCLNEQKRFRVLNVELFLSNSYGH